MKSEMYGEDIVDIQRRVFLKTKLLLEKINKVDHKALNEFLISDLEDIQADHTLVENFLRVSLWLEEESKGK